jgi:mono/diheme cytochrome c family protein
MRDLKTAIAVILIAIIFYLVFPSPSWAGDDPAALFQSKCAVCHGADGQANTPLGKKQSIASFASDRIQKAPNADLVEFILNGGKEKRASHSFAAKGVSQENAAALAGFIKTLGKKK